MMHSSRSFFLVCSIIVLFAALVEGKVVTNSGKTKGGLFRYHYDDSISAGYECETIALIGVGTMMKIEDYDKLSAKISEGKPIVTVVTDHNPRTFVKLSSKKYAKLYNSITSNLGDLIPVCKGKNPKIITGGHSASGKAAIGALSKMDPKPNGVLGLDPYDINEKRVWFPRPSGKTVMDETIPILTWGLERATCKVKVKRAARAAYNISGNSHRVFYRSKNMEGESRKLTHCEVTDKGCGLVCGKGGGDIIYDNVATSIHTFIAAIKKGSIQRADFEIPSLNADLFVNADEVTDN